MLIADRLSAVLEQVTLALVIRWAACANRCDAGSSIAIGPTLLNPFDGGTEPELFDAWEAGSNLALS